RRSRSHRRYVSAEHGPLPCATSEILRIELGGCPFREAVLAERFAVIVERNRLLATAARLADHVARAAAFLAGADAVHVRIIAAVATGVDRAFARAFGARKNAHTGIPPGTAAAIRMQATMIRASIQGRSAVKLANASNARS